MMRRLPVIVFLSFCLCVSAAAQTTTFTYQGKLADNGVPANANYDFEFRLFTVDTGGTALGTLQRLNAEVANGVFTVTLDFGGQFGGSDRWLEIAVKPAGSPDPFTTLTPRQLITSAPYAMRSMSAANATNALLLGGIAASQYVLTSDPRMSDARNPLPNSTNYVQNRTTQQAATNFNISGNGTVGGTLAANAVTATTQFNIGANRILSNPGTANLFAGVGAGQANTTGGNNAFFGSSSGASNTTGSQNAFFGYFAGITNSTGNRNAFFGYRAGQNSTSDDNAFFGYRAGAANTANSNSFFGSNAGSSNTTGDNNSFFGFEAGGANTAGTRNAFFGYQSGTANTSGDTNSFFGYQSGTSNNGSNNAFFGASAGASNTSGVSNAFFGRISGGNNTTGDSNTFLGSTAGISNSTGSNNTIIGASANVGTTNLSFATAIGANAEVSTSNTIALGRSDGSDKVVIYGLGAAGSTDVCRNASKQLATCSSSLRYKTDIQSFLGGLDVVRRLRPIAFNWKEGGRRDIGFGAEEVGQVEPLLVTYNAKGDIEGVKYGQLTTVLINAIKEQQAQITEQQSVIRQQQQQLANLQKLVCLDHPQSDICKPSQEGKR